ncbi:hypothetical protein HN451_00175 [archaeon]|jgi:hypothetical protein|nr:hypothetical protein [archaeon]
MEYRVQFDNGKQREFLDLVVNQLGCVSVRGILQFGFDVSYSCLKNYYVERRMMSRGFFRDLCHVAKIDSSSLGVNYVLGNLGCVRGGKVGKRRKRKE